MNVWVVILPERAVAWGRRTRAGATSDPDERLATGAAVAGWCHRAGHAWKGRLARERARAQHRIERVHRSGWLGQPVKDWGPKRPHATKPARVSRIRVTTIPWASRRRTCVMNAPTISNTRPTAASGTRTGAMSSVAGRIRPTAARTSRVPMALMLLPLKSSTPPAEGGQLLLGPGELHGAAAQEGHGQQSGSDPQSDVHEGSPVRSVEIGGRSCEWLTAAS